MFIGLDPGVNGGAACVDEAGKPLAVIAFGKSTERDIWNWLLAQNDVQAVYLEDVSASPQMGVVSAFTFGKGFGRLEAWGIALGATWNAPYHKVRPLKWQTLLGCRSKGNKNVTKAKAQQLFPSLKITHAISDALLIAEYARRVTLGIK